MYRPKSFNHDEIRIIEIALRSSIETHLFTYRDGTDFDMQLAKQLHTTFKHRLSLEKAFDIMADQEREEMLENTKPKQQSQEEIAAILAKTSSGLGRQE